MSTHHDAAQQLDAREIDGEPFGAITAALEELDADETLLLRCVLPCNQSCSHGGSTHSPSR